MKSSIFAVGKSSRRSGLRVRAVVLPVRNTDGVIVGRAVVHSSGLALYLDPGAQASRLSVGGIRIE